MKYRRIISLNVAAFLLLCLWLFLPEVHNLADEWVFRFFNQFIGAGHLRWEHFLARVNMRKFDLVAASIMSLLFFWSIYLQRSESRWDGWVRWFCIGLIMLLTITAIKLVVEFTFTYKTASPTRVLDDVELLSNYITDFRFRDRAGSSFPGDHGIVLITCSLVMWRFARRRVAWASVPLVVFLSAPRILVGAHWFTDVYFGSMFPVLLIGPWILYIPDWDSLLDKAELISSKLLGRAIRG